MRALSTASLASAAMLALSSTIGCGQYAQLKAMRSFKAANQAYQQNQFEKSAELYEETLKEGPPPQVEAQTYFYLANSYDNQFKPSRKGEAANDALLEKAVEYYQKASDRLSGSSLEADKNLGKRSLEFLVAAYGADKLNDPAKAEPVVQQMIKLEPGVVENYFALAKIYEDAGAYEEAEEMLLAAKNARPNDAAVYMQLAGYYNRQNQFDKTIDALQQRATAEPNNPEAYFTIATYYWDNAQRNFRLKENEKRDQVEKGLDAVEKALKIRADYMEAIVYKGLLLRVQANLENDPAKQQALIKEAVSLQNQADEIRKKRTAGA
jgi:tetratricopeptide (TPR) repeat protein